MKETTASPTSTEADKQRSRRAGHTNAALGVGMASLLVAYVTVQNLSNSETPLHCLETTFNSYTPTGLGNGDLEASLTCEGSPTQEELREEIEVSANTSMGDIQQYFPQFPATFIAVCHATKTAIIESNTVTNFSCHIVDQKYIIKV